MKIRRILPLAVLSLMLVTLIPSVGAGSVERFNPYYTTDYVNQQVYITQAAPMFADMWSGTSLGSLPYATRGIVTDAYGDMIQIYTFDTHKACWIPRSNVTPQKRMKPAIVISSSVSLRESANTNAKLVMSIPNGEVVNVLSEYNGWMNIEYDEVKTGVRRTGYVRSDFMLANPRFLILTALTDVYAMPAQGTKKVGQLAKGTSLPIIAETGAYLCVNLRQASGFIRKSDVGY